MRRSNLCPSPLRAQEKMCLDPCGGTGQCRVGPGCWRRGPGSRSRQCLAPTPIPAGQTFQVGRFRLTGAEGRSYVPLTGDPWASWGQRLRHTPTRSDSLIQLMCIYRAPPRSPTSVSSSFRCRGYTCGHQSSGPQEFTF